MRPHPSLRSQFATLNKDVRKRHEQQTNEYNILKSQFATSNTCGGKQVMLDTDVAMLYHYETKNVWKWVK